MKQILKKINLKYKILLIMILPIISFISVSLLFLFRLYNDYLIEKDQNSSLEEPQLCLLVMQPSP